MPDSNTYNIKFKICLVGESQVGKTSLVRRYVMDIFSDEYISTLGTKVSKKNMIIKRNDINFNLTLSIWDVLGQEQFTNLQTMAFKGSRGAILVFDITRKKTFKNIPTWISRLKDSVGEIPYILLANKCDLTDNYEISEEDIESFSSNLNIPYFMTSAKYGDNVIKTFFRIGNLIIDNIFVQDSNQVSNGIKLANAA